MQYFVTGATGFIGKRLVKKLLERKGSVVHFLIRKESDGKVAGLRKYWGASAAQWQSGDTLTLTNADGIEQATFTIP